MKKDIEPSVPQRERKHAAVLSAARKVFLNHGFEGASMDEVAKVASVSKKTIYDHFGNKENLFQSIVVEHWNIVFDKNKPLFFAESKSITKDLTNFANIFLDFLYQQETIDLFRLLISESHRFPNILDKLLVNDKAPFTRELTKYLEAKKKKNELQIKDLDRSASYFMGLLKEYHFWPMMLGFTKQKEMKNQNQLIKEVVELFVKAHL